MIIAEYDLGNGRVFISGETTMVTELTNERNIHRMVGQKLMEDGKTGRFVIKHHHPPGYQAEWITTTGILVPMPTDNLRL